MQHWFALSDPGMEDEDREYASAGIKLNGARSFSTSAASSKTTICIDILDKISIWHAKACCWAPWWMRRHARPRIKQAGETQHQTKKGNQWYFGMKVHIGVDAIQGWSIPWSPLEADVSIKNCHGKEQTVYTGAGSIAKRAGVGTSIKRGRLKKTEGEQKDKLRAEESAKASIRARVEHPFHTLKCVFGYTKARFKGLAKNTSQVVLLFALVNLHRVRKKLMAIKERQEWGQFKAEVQKQGRLKFVA